jgi:hypothetical protein
LELTIVKKSVATGNNQEKAREQFEGNKKGEDFQLLCQTFTVVLLPIKHAAPSQADFPKEITHKENAMAGFSHRRNEHSSMTSDEASLSPRRSRRWVSSLSLLATRRIYSVLGPSSLLIFASQPICTMRKGRTC